MNQLKNMSNLIVAEIEDLESQLEHPLSAGERKQFNDRLKTLKRLIKKNETGEKSEQS